MIRTGLGHFSPHHLTTPPHWCPWSGWALDVSPHTISPHNTTSPHHLSPNCTTLMSMIRTGLGRFSPHHLSRGTYQLGHQDLEHQGTILIHVGLALHTQQSPQHVSTSCPHAASSQLLQACPEATGMPQGYRHAPRLQACPKATGMPQGYRHVPRLQACPKATGMSQGYRYAPRLQACPKATGMPQGYRHVPRLQACPKATSHHPRLNPTKTISSLQL